MPNGWEWTNVASIALINQRNKLNDTLKTSFIPMTLINDGFDDFHRSEIKKWEEIKSGFTHFAEGDIALAKITPSFQNRKSAILKELTNGYGAGTTEIYSVRILDQIQNTLILYFFKSKNFINEGIRNFSGAVGQQRIPKEFLKTYLIPMPPIPEQKKILTKIKDLFNILNIIENEQTELSNLSQQLKSKVLEEAMQGNLVEQDPNDEPASVLLEQIQEEKQKFYEEGKIKKKDLKTTTISKRDNSYYKNDSISIPLSHIVTISNPKLVEYGLHPYLTVKYIRKEENAKIKRKGRFIKKEKLIILVDGSNSGEIFSTPEDGYLGSTFRELIIPKSLSKKYVLFFIHSHRDFLTSNKVGSAIPHLNKKLFGELKILLFPKVHQDIIVKKIELLFSQIDHLL